MDCSKVPTTLRWLGWIGLGTILGFAFVFLMLAWGDGLTSQQLSESLLTSVSLL